jgi:hypothetical protein
VTESTSAAQHCSNVISTPVPEHEESRPTVQEPKAQNNLEALALWNSSTEGLVSAARLQEALSLLPEDIKKERCARILQCIHKAGSSQILSSLKALTSTAYLTEPPGYTDVERLSYIHCLLENQDCTSHIAIVRSRFVRLEYFETFQNAVQSLSAVKRARHVERLRLIRIRRTATYRQGLCCMLTGLSLHSLILHIYIAPFVHSYSINSVLHSPSISHT